MNRVLGISLWALLSGTTLVWSQDKDLVVKISPEQEQVLIDLAAGKSVTKEEYVSDKIEEFTAEEVQAKLQVEARNVGNAYKVASSSVRLQVLTLLGLK